MGGEAGGRVPSPPCFASCGPLTLTLNEPHRIDRSPYALKKLILGAPETTSCWGLAVAAASKSAGEV